MLMMLLDCAERFIDKASLPPDLGGSYVAPNINVYVQQMVRRKERERECLLKSLSPASEKEGKANLHSSSCRQTARIDSDSRFRLEMDVFSFSFFVQMMRFRMMARLFLASMR
jgi:hypothetical protein